MKGSYIALKSSRDILINRTITTENFTRLLGPIKKPFQLLTLDGRLGWETQI